MAWTAPITFTAGSILTTANLNTYLRDNMLETAPAVGTTVGDYFVSDAANSLARREPKSSRVATAVATASAVFVALGAGTPTVSTTTGTRALIFWATRIENSVTNDNALCSYAVGGATVHAASDIVAVAIDGVTAANFLRSGMVNMDTSLTAGVNTFTHNYRAGGGGTATFTDRWIQVMPF